MPAPTFTDGTIGNVINAASVAAGKAIAAFLDLSTIIEGQLALDVQAGATAPTVATVFTAYRAQAAYHSGSANLTLSSGVTANTASTTLSVASQNATTGLRVGEQIALVSASTKVGELVTITSVSGTGPYTVGITGGGTNSGTLNNYSSSDLVFVMVQTPVDSATPTIPAATKGNSAPMWLGAGRYVVAASNPDASQAVTVTVTVDKIPSYA